MKKYSSIRSRETTSNGSTTDRHPSPPSSTPSEIPDGYVNKTVSFRYSGVGLKFALSHALFSSYDVDAGTKLLLKLLLRHPLPSAAPVVLDLGCGTGVIGIGVKTLYPDARLILSDRDELACAFARRNLRFNGIDEYEVSCELGFGKTNERRFDLITSNLPAKAGAPVLEAVLGESIDRLATGGMGAVVIVRPLAAFARSVLTSRGATLIDAEASSDHEAIVFDRKASVPPHPAGASESAAKDDSLAPYVRNRALFSLGDESYEMRTVFGISDFDSIGHETHLASRLIGDYFLASDGQPSPGGAGLRILVWNPGQGHIAVFAARKLRPTSIVLAGRDLLQLRISESNLGDATRRFRDDPSCLDDDKRRPPEVSLLPLPAFASLAEVGIDSRPTVPPESFDLVILFPDDVPGYDFAPAARATIDLLLKDDGMAVAVGGSTPIGRLIQLRSACSTVADKKRKTARGAVFRKKRPV